jgi:hypothetical protein
MKSFVAILSYLAATALAAPATNYVIMNIANDALGLTGVARINIDGLDHAIGTDFARTFLAKARFEANTAYITYYPPSTPFACSINSPSHPINGVLTAQNTIIKFGDGRNALSQVNLAGATINCNYLS